MENGKGKKTEQVNFSCDEDLLQFLKKAAEECALAPSTLGGILVKWALPHFRDVGYSVPALRNTVVIKREDQDSAPGPADVLPIPKPRRI